jgi:hypothetical protein
MSTKDKILEIYKSDWEEAIADAAYFMTSNSKKSEYIDQHETTRDMRRYKELIEKLNKFDSTIKWNEYMNILATRTGISYITERATGNNLSFGGPMTFIGHSSHTFIDWGFLGYLAYSIDNGNTEKLFNEYVSIDTKFHYAVHSGDYATGEQLADEWRLSMAAVDEAWEKLRTLLGIDNLGE